MPWLRQAAVPIPARLALLLWPSGPLFSSCRRAAWLADAGSCACSPLAPGVGAHVAPKHSVGVSSATGQA
jgi:hypothetical protein